MRGQTLAPLKVEEKKPREPYKKNEETSQLWGEKWGKKECESPECEERQKKGRETKKQRAKATLRKKQE